MSSCPVSAGTGPVRRGAWGDTHAPHSYSGLRLGMVALGLVCFGGLRWLEVAFRSAL